ncbi:hypothetical protein NVV99_23495 [Rhodococcus sp. PAE-6]|uniref:hypothetical protein n=1 Tax=Rhodococcus TaxID=1827 RepID=UPI00041A14C0|nr:MULTISPECIES: hypothetical protein [Rhodococcus]MCT7293874.1 hypothetical protein [Rhodococcus sp. PAE-6]
MRISLGDTGAARTPGPPQSDAPAGACGQQEEPTHATCGHRAGSGHGGRGGAVGLTGAGLAQATTGGDYVDSDWTESTIDLGVEARF